MAASEKGQAADAFQMLLRSTAEVRQSVRHRWEPRNGKRRKNSLNEGSAFCECVICGCSIPRAILSIHANECLDSLEGRSEGKGSDPPSVPSEQHQQARLVENRDPAITARSFSAVNPAASRDPELCEAKQLLRPSGPLLGFASGAGDETGKSGGCSEAGGGHTAAAGDDGAATKAPAVAWWTELGGGCDGREPPRANRDDDHDHGGERPAAPIDLRRPEPMKQARISFGLGLITRGYQPEPQSVTVLQTGMVLLRNQLDIAMQQRLVDELQSNAEKFHRPHTRGGRKYHLYRMCYGGHGDPAAQQYMGGGGMPHLPDWLMRLGQSLGQVAQRHSPVYPPELRFDPDIAMVNYYPVRSEQLGTVRLGGHVDNDSNSIMPVVSLSIGDSMTFFYRRLPPLSRRPGLVSRGVPLAPGAADCDEDNAADNKEHVLILKSGDVLVFGGESRMVYHGTRDVLPGTKPLPLCMAPGRVNITFRQHVLPQDQQSMPGSVRT